MFDLATYLLFVGACIAIVIVPGPTVTVIVANSLRYGTRAGVMNVIGTQVGVAMMIAILAIGLATVVELVGQLFTWLKLIGAAYLIYLGIRLWMSDGALGTGEASRERSDRGFLLQGFFVIWSNPKALLFFGALIPQFINPAGNAALQTMLLGGTFMIVATVLDLLYGLLAGKTGLLLSRRNVRLVEMIGGGCLIGGGIWIMLARRA